MDVTVKEGMLYLQGVKFGKKTWRKVWSVLVKHSSMGVGRLELCNICYSLISEQKKMGHLRALETKVVHLSDCLSVTSASKESCPSGCTAFYLNTSTCTYTLASDSSQDWMSALCLLAFQKDPGESSKGDFDRGNGFNMEENDLYSTWRTDSDLPPNTYKVTVQSTEASRRCRLSGNFLISTDTEAVMLLDVSSSCVICHWPYRMLRKFGQVEGGFSIEAGRRCESGPGLFTFLSKHAPEIFQLISSHCFEKMSTRPTSLDQSHLPLPKPTKQPATPPACRLTDVSTESDDESADHYTTINHSGPCNWSSLVRAHLANSREAVGGKNGGEDERCQSLEAEGAGNAAEDSIYYNLQRASPLRTTDQFMTEEEGSQPIYSYLKFTKSSLNPPPLPSSSALPPPPPPSTLPNPPPKPWLPPPMSSSVQAGYSTVDNMKEIEEAISSTCHVTPAESPGSFKHRLAAIISKDLAKLQPPLPPGTGSLTFSQ